MVPICFGRVVDRIVPSPHSRTCLELRAKPRPYIRMIGMRSTVIVLTIASCCAWQVGITGVSMLDAFVRYPLRVKSAGRS